MRRRHRTLRQPRRSLSVRRKSPTSAWRRSISSTRRTLGAACRWHGCGAAAAAEVAELAELAAVAGAVAALAAAAAACRGERVAFARSGRFPIALKYARRHGRVRRFRPGQFVSSLRSRLPGCASRPADGDQVNLQGIAVAEQRMQRRSGMVRQMRVQRS